MKKILVSSFRTICVLCVIYLNLSAIVICLLPWPAWLFGLVILSSLLIVLTSLVYIRDTVESEKFTEPVEEGPDLRTLVFRALMSHLDKATQISEKTFLGSREPEGYVHVFVEDASKSFQLFFKTTSNLRKVNRIAHSAFMSLDGCDVMDDISSCGMRGFEAVSQARNELYRVFVYRNPHTKHIRVYVCVQTPYPPGYVTELV